jgi:3-oxoacyl-(acyl-carrier-protein) synthase III
VTSTNIGILGTGSYLPRCEVTNDELAARFNVTPEWIVHKTRIHSRRYAAATEATSDLAGHAATAALEHASLSPEDIDYLVVVTSTGDFRVPPTACVLQRAINARRAACFDLNVACSGFVYGLAIARGLLSVSGRFALVTAADVWSRYIDPADRSTAVLLGDGAGAVVLGPVPQPYGILDIDLRSVGDRYELLVAPGGGSRNVTATGAGSTGSQYLAMRGREVTEFVLESVPRTLGDLLDRAGFCLADVTHFVPHQANGVMLDNLAAKVGLPAARMHLTLERYGNLGSASIPATLDEVSRTGALHRGDLVLLSGFGSGMSIGNCLLRWGNGTDAAARAQ